jgi:DNA-binding MarR family transcriptional regulator
MAEESESDLLEALDATLWLARMLERSEAPLTTSQFRIMRRAAAGGERAARLAERLAVRKPTLTAIADGLVGAGYLVRESDATDRRAVRLQLTPAGETALAKTEQIFAERFAELLDDSSKPEVLRALLADLEQNRVARLVGTNQPGQDKKSDKGVATA